LRNKGAYVLLSTYNSHKKEIIEKGRGEKINVWLFLNKYTLKVVFTDIQKASFLGPPH
jgi:uncharacterized UPF0146 family protein